MIQLDFEADTPAQAGAAPPGRGGDRLGRARLTWRELDETRARLAAGYRGLGLEPGDRIASLMPNRIALVVHYLACFKAGLVATPLNYRYTAPRDRPRARGERRPRAARPRGARATTWPRAELAGDLPLGVISLRRARRRRRPSLEALAAGPRPPAPSSTAADPAERPAAIFFTSGSTGPGQGGHPHARDAPLDVRQRGDGVRARPPDDVFLPGSSMSHIGSFLWTLRDAARSARGSSWRARFDAHEILPLLREHRPTVLAMIPAALTAAGPRPRRAARRLRLAADLPRRRRQGLDRARGRVHRAGRASRSTRATA